MTVPDVVVVRLDAPDPARAAHLAFDMDRRPVRVCGDGGRRIPSYLQGEGDDDPCFVEGGINEVSI